jgi:glutamate carboxypeptidase
MADLTLKERTILDWLAAQRPAMLALLEALVNTDSGSYDKPGVEAVGARLRGFLESHGIAHDVIPDDRFGDALRASVGSGPNTTILLMGHRDTVFPQGEAARRPFRIEGERAYGPGVADMKPGLVMNAFVLAAFAKFGGAPAPLVGLFTGDEEIGSPFSRPLIEAEARRARAVFNAEPGRPSGAVVTARKGGVFMRLGVTGRAAHSGANFEQGISAIEELARKIVALHALTDIARGITVNVGIVRGGQTVNTVAPSAEAEVDLRFLTRADRDVTMTRIKSIADTSYVPGTGAKLEIFGEFLPLVEAPDGERLYRHYAGCAEALGVNIPAEFTGGCADSGFAAGVGAPTLCATGPVGGKAHTPEEYLDLESIVPRAQALALAILRLGQAQLSASPEGRA